MQIILKKDLKGLGKAFEVVKVKDGYGRNCLLPQGLAVAATRANLRSVEADKALEARRQAQLRSAAIERARSLQGASVTISVRVHEDDKLYGSVNAADIAAKLVEAGHNIDKTLLVLDEPLRSLGVFQVPVRLFQDVESRVKVWVVKQAG